MEWTELAMVLGLGLVAGILSGLFGIGGGLVIVPALILLFRFEVKMAIGTSLFALLLPTGLLGALEYWRRGEIRMLHGALIAFGIFCGAYLGARMTAGVSPVAMKRAYGAFLIAIYFLWSSSPDRLKPRPPADPGAGAKHITTPDPQPVH